MIILYKRSGLWLTSSQGASQRAQGCYKIIIEAKIAAFWYPKRSHWTNPIFHHHVLDSGVLISGGYNRGNLKSAEMYIPESRTTCSLPELPEYKYTHTQEGPLACGGYRGYRSCVKWSSDFGNWTHSHTLRTYRYDHVSWKTEDGIYLIGGASSSTTTELVKEDGSVQDGFSLKYSTR